MKKRLMASIKFDNFLIDVTVHNVDGFLQKILRIPIPNGFWVFLTVQNEHGKKEYFPSVDENFRVKIYQSYAEAIDDVARVLKEHFAE